MWGSDSIGYDTAAGEMVTRQLDYYETNGVTASENLDKILKSIGTNSSSSSWWLRSPISALSPAFSTVNESGNWGYVFVNRESGVSPAFRIGLEEQSS